MSAGKSQAVNLAQAPEAASPPAAQQYEFASDLVTLTEDRPAEAEAIRTIRTHVIARHIRDGRRGIALCAPTPEVGCTFTATNLAVALAQVGTSTLLIDGDMREPAVQRLIRPLRPTPGLKDCVGENETPAIDCIHRDVLPNLSVMFAGDRAENAQELLASENFQRLIERCLRDFEFTVIDTPPANRCADARRISSIIGYALIVARANTTLMNDVSTLAHRLQDDGARVVGTVLNET